MVQSLFRSILSDDIAIVFNSDGQYVDFSLLSDTVPKTHRLYFYDFHLMFVSDENLYNELLQNAILMTPFSTFTTEEKMEKNIEKIINGGGVGDRKILLNP